MSKMSEANLPTPQRLTHHRLERYENTWFGVAAFMSILLFVGVIASFFSGTYPSIKGEGSSHHLSGVTNGRLDPNNLSGTPFEASKLGLVQNEDGTYEAFVVGKAFQFQPSNLIVPIGKPITFHITSVDVLHGFYVEGTNINSSVLPGQVSSFTTVFKKKGRLNVICNEYCGTGHHNMLSVVTVK